MKTSENNKHKASIEVEKDRKKIEGFIKKYGKEWRKLGEDIQISKKLRI